MTQLHFPKFSDILIICCYNPSDMKVNKMDYRNNLNFNGALLTVYLYMLYPIATFQKAGTCLDDHQSMAKQQHGETANQKLCE